MKRKVAKELCVGVRSHRTAIIEVGRRKPREGVGGEGSISAGISACFEGSWGVRCLDQSCCCSPGPLSCPCFAFPGWNILPCPPGLQQSSLGQKLLEVVISIG